MQKNVLTNLSAIQKMSAEEMIVFLDYVYTTGLNDGMCVADLPDDSDEKNAVIDNCPYNEEWLLSEAYLLEIFVKSVSRML